MDRAADERKEIQAQSGGSGATPFALLGLVVVGVVGYLILSGSNVFGTSTDDPPPEALASTADDLEISPWNNDDGGPVGNGDDALMRSMARACRNDGVPVDGASTYRRTGGAHPVAIVDLRFGELFTGTDNDVQRAVVPRQVSPDVLADTELILCATDALEPGVDSVECPVAAATDEQPRKRQVELAGNDTVYKLVVAATGEILWSHTRVFSEAAVGTCESPRQAVEWGQERMQFPDPFVWTEIAKWAIGRGPEPVPTADHQESDNPVTDDQVSDVDN